MKNDFYDIKEAMDMNIELKEKPKYYYVNARIGLSKIEFRVYKDFLEEAKYPSGIENILAAYFILQFYAIFKFVIKSLLEYKKEMYSKIKTPEIIKIMKESHNRLGSVFYMGKKASVLPFRKYTINIELGRLASPTPRLMKFFTDYINDKISFSNENLEEFFKKNCPNYDNEHIQEHIKNFKDIIETISHEISHGKQKQFTKIGEIIYYLERAVFESEAEYMGRYIVSKFENKDIKLYTEFKEEEDFWVCGSKSNGHNAFKITINKHLSKEGFLNNPKKVLEYLSDLKENVLKTINKNIVNTKTLKDIIRLLNTELFFKRDAKIGDQEAYFISIVTEDNYFFPKLAKKEDLPRIKFSNEEKRMLEIINEKNYLKEIGIPPECIQ